MYEYLQIRVQSTLKNNVSLLQKIYLPCMESNITRPIQLAISPAMKDDFELECSFLKNIHVTSVILCTDKDSTMKEASVSCKYKAIIESTKTTNKCGRRTSS